MRIFSKVLPATLLFAFLVQAAFASEGIYDRDLVRGFLSLKGDFRSMHGKGIQFINQAAGVVQDKTKPEYKGRGYVREYLDGHAEIGAEYKELRTWFDIDFMPITPTRKNKFGETTEWYSYGITWMWGYKLLHQNSRFNVIPSLGPGVELLNIRTGPVDRVTSSLGPALNLEFELRLQFPQFSAGIYGGYKVVRHYGWDSDVFSLDESIDVNADKIFVGLKLSWTMLNNFQKRERELQ